MAAPPSKTLQSLSGKWKLYKELSDDFTSVLALQGVNALIRKASSAAAVHLTITQPSHNQVNMKQTATAAAIPSATEEYTLDWQWRSNHDALFGDIEGRSRRISVRDARREGGQGDWVQGDSEWKLVNAVGGGLMALGKRRVRGVLRWSVGTGGIRGG